MARGKKKKDSNNEDIKSNKHEAETRKNAVPVGLASYDTSRPKPKKYEYDPHLDPQLIWSGKKEHTSFEVPMTGGVYMWLALNYLPVKSL